MPDWSGGGVSRSVGLEEFEGEEEFMALINEGDTTGSID